MRFAICNEVFEGWSLERQFGFIRDTGYGGVELAPFTIAKSVTEVGEAERGRLRRLAAEAGVAVVGLHWLLVGPEGLHITHPDLAVRQRTSEYLDALLHFCADVGGRVLVFGSPAQRNVLPGVTRDQALDYLVTAFRRAVRLAEARDVTLCLEPLPPPECNFIQTTAEAIEVLEAVGNAHLRLILDVKSMAGERDATGVDIPDIIRRTAPYVAHVQANDANRGMPGSGAVDFVPIFRALRDIDYRGYVSVEVFDFSPGPERIARDSIAYLQRCLAAADQPQPLRA